MDANLANALIMYLGLLVLLTFHEFGHAWMAMRCGDDTAYSQGRVSLNPAVHIDPIGTVALPLFLIFFAPPGFFVGWAKPVPVNPYNLRNPKVDDILVTLAGPWMNVLLGVVLIGLMRLGVLLHSGPMVELCAQMAQMSLLLCFFNLIPIPPLDGSQVLRNLVGMTYETYAQIGRYGFVILLLVMQFRPLQIALSSVTLRSFGAISGLFGMPI